MTMPTPARAARSGLLALLLLAATPAIAQDAVVREGEMRQVSVHQGAMMSPRQSAQDTREQRDVIRFEPIEMIQDLVSRHDLVFLMRHGPTDWSHPDIYDVAPTDCANQRVQSAQGRIDMQNLGVLLADNALEPGMIAVSEWCRNQETVENLLVGMRVVDPGYATEVETDPELNLLLSLQGATDVTALRDRISSWTGEGASGPLLIVTHYTNIDELTNYSVYEGEMLIIDPKRDNRVLGYLRLRSAGPDAGHFAMAGNAVTPADVVSANDEMDCPILPVGDIGE